MKRYRVEVVGTNFLLDLDGEHGKFGFAAVRVIKAHSAAEAERFALIRIHHELNQSAHIVKNTPDVPRVFINSIEELKFFQLLSKKRGNRLEFICEE